jgi:methionyl-tRNA formyltransferase
MKLVFMGTPEFSATILTEILTTEHQVVGVVTQPDRPAGRGHKLKAPPVKVLAEKKNIPVLQTEDLKHLDFLAQL